MISPGRHQKKEVAAALAAAKSAGLEVLPAKNGHRWGWVTCPSCGRRITVWGTPRSPSAHARDIARFIQHTCK